MNLSGFTNKQLTDELDKRKNEHPEPLQVYNFSELVGACKEYIRNIKDGHGKNGKQWIYEAALEAVYGEEIWKWMRDR